MIPPVTMLAVPIVSRTKPQKMPGVHQRRRAGSLNIFVWRNAYSIRPTNRRGMSPNGLGPLGADGREDPQVAGHGEHEERDRAPEERRRPAGSTGTAGTGSKHQRSPPGVVIVRTGEGLERVVQHGLDRGERLERAFGLPGRLTTSVRPTTPTTPRDRSANGVCARPSARIASARPGTS